MVVASISILKLFGDFRIITLSQYFINIIESYKDLVYPLLSFLDDLFVVQEYTKDWVFASFFILDQVFFRYRSKSKNLWLSKYVKNQQKLKNYRDYLDALEHKFLSLVFAVFMGVGVSGAYYIGPFENEINDVIGIENVTQDGGDDIMLPMMGVFLVGVPIFIICKSLLFNILYPIIRLVFYALLHKIPFLKNKVGILLSKAWKKFYEGEKIIFEKLKISKDLLVYSLKVAFIIFLIFGLNYFFFLAEA